MLQTTKRAYGWSLRVGVVAALAGAPAAAATFTATANTVCNGIETDVRVDAPASVSRSGYSCSGVNGPWQGNSLARADSGGIGLDVDFYSSGSLMIGQASGEIDTTFIITGPTSDPIDISINFVLSGFLGGGTAAGQVSTREIEVGVTVLSNYGGGTLVFGPYIGKAAEKWNYLLGLDSEFSGPLAPAGTNCLNPCVIQTQPFTVYPGFVNNLELRAVATVSSGNGFGYGEAKFFNTFYFPKSGPVFNLPDGYTASVAGLNVENNRVVGGDVGEVPEPGTYALVGAGLAAVWLIRRRS